MKEKCIDNFLAKLKLRIIILRISNIFSFLVRLSKCVARGEELKYCTFSKTVIKTEQMYFWTCTFGDTSCKACIWCWEKEKCLCSFLTVLWPFLWVQFFLDHPVNHFYILFFGIKQFQLFAENSMNKLTNIPWIWAINKIDKLPRSKSTFFV